MSGLTDFEDEVANVQSEAELRDALRTALRALDDSKRSKQELVDAVYRAARDAASAFDVPDVPKPAADRRRSNPLTAISTIGDWQFAKVTPSYSSDVAEQRITVYADELLKDVAEIRRTGPVRDLRIWALGDIVEGELIFPGQAHQIDASLYEQVFRAGAVMRDFIRRMAGSFDRVDVVGIIGNHGALGGRSRRDYNPETNADRFLYRHVAEVLEAKSPKSLASFTIPQGFGESSWYHVDRVGNYGSLLFHGYNLRGHAGFPWYGLGKKVGGWALGAIEEFRIADEGDLDVDFGHFHQPTRVTLNRVTARCVGSPESHNTFAQEQLAAVGRPSQGLRFVDPVAGRVTWERTIWLDEASS